MTHTNCIRILNSAGGGAHISTDNYQIGKDKGGIYMGYFDWNGNGRLDSIDTATELRMLEEIQKQNGTYTEGYTYYNLIAAATVVGVFLSIVSFLG